MSHVRHTTGSGGSGRAAARTGAAVIVTAAAALVASAVLAAPANAAKPNHQACLGEDVRTYAQMGSGFGAFVSQVADGGAGPEIQAHLAGLIPDEVVPNACND